jgi:hypothetical protein
MANSIESLQYLDSSFYEEDSYEFLIFYQFYKDWIVYDSEEIPYDTVYSLTTNFINFHGKIPFPETVLDDLYWSAVPLGTFRYKMLEDQSCSIIAKNDDTPGFIVEGMYWFNGFYYIVRDQDNIVQIKLFIDSNTHYLYSYP